MKTIQRSFQTTVVLKPCVFRTFCSMSFESLEKKPEIVRSYNWL
jgi:hypothetical protein